MIRRPPTNAFSGALFLAAMTLAMAPAAPALAATPDPAAFQYVAPAEDASTSPAGPGPSSSDPWEPRVTGFGTRLPLTAALRAIVPATIATSYAPGVNPQTPVSWNGQGRAWRDVLVEALAAAGLAVRFDDRRVIIDILVRGPSAEATPVPTDPPPLPTVDAGPAPAPPLALLAAVQQVPLHEATPTGLPAPGTASRPGVPVTLAAQSRSTAPPSPATTPRPAPPPDPRTINGAWQIRSGQTLQEILEAWSRQAGLKPPVYESEYVYRVGFDDTFDGDLLSALDYLFGGLHQRTPPPDYLFYARTRNIRVLPADHSPVR